MWHEFKRVGYDYEQEEDMIQKLSKTSLIISNIHSYQVKGNNLNINHIP
jgi:hypothetical protein